MTTLVHTFVFSLDESDRRQLRLQSSAVRLLHTACLVGVNYHMRMMDSIFLLRFYVNDIVSFLYKIPRLAHTFYYVDLLSVFHLFFRGRSLIDGVVRFFRKCLENLYV